MLETYIIDGVTTEVIILKKSINAEVVEVTTFTDRARNYIHSGYNFLKLQGKTTNGEEINSLFVVVGKKEDILEVEALANDQDLKFRVR